MCSLFFGVERNNGKACDTYIRAWRFRKRQTYLVDIRIESRNSFEGNKPKTQSVFRLFLEKNPKSIVWVRVEGHKVHNGVQIWFSWRNKQKKDQTKVVVLKTTIWKQQNFGEDSFSCYLHAKESGNFGTSLMHQKTNVSSFCSEKNRYHWELSRANIRF